MFIEIVKEYTRIYRIKEVKRAIAIFKKEFTENDLRNMFEYYFDEDCSGRITDCEIKAGEQNYYTNKIFFAIKIIIDDIDTVKKIMYAILYDPDDESFKVNLNPDTAQYRIYE